MRPLIAPRNVLAFWGVLLLILILAVIFRPGPGNLEPAPSYSLAERELSLAKDSRLASRLEVVPVGAAAETSAEFRSVGQIVALSNPSGELTGNRIAWVELDQQMTASLGLRLDKAEPAGVAYGLTAVPAEFADRVRPGQELRVWRYALKRSAVSAAVVMADDAPGGLNVVFRFTQGQEWFPGTNCEVAFPVLKGRPVKVPTTAPIHEGLQEYVWKELAPGRYAALPVSLIDATSDEATVLGLAPGDRIIAGGAILLKPMLHELLLRQAEPARKD